VKTIRVVLAAPPAADVATRRDSRDYLHFAATAAERETSPGAPGPAAVAAVIDVLRATTTLTVALSHGAVRVIPAGTVEEAFAARRGQSDALLCGERDGRKIRGFDLGNSPLEYTPEIVGGRPLIFASTNGSQALKLAARAGRRVLAAFVNASAAVESLARATEVWLVAAGKLGRFSLEDAACAGWLIRALSQRGFAAEGSAARLALAVAPNDPAGIRSTLEGCSHGRYLVSLGGAFARDLEFCSRLDAIPAAYEV